MASLSCHQELAEAEASVWVSVLAAFPCRPTDTSSMAWKCPRSFTFARPTECFKAAARIGIHTSVACAVDYKLEVDMAIGHLHQVYLFKAADNFLNKVRHIFRSGCTPDSDFSRPGRFCNSKRMHVCGRRSGTPIFRGRGKCQTVLL